MLCGYEKRDDKSLERRNNGAVRRPRCIFDAQVSAEFLARDVEATMATMANDPYVTHVPADGEFGARRRCGVLHLLFHRPLAADTAAQTDFAHDWPRASYRRVRPKPSLTTWRCRRCFLACSEQPKVEPPAVVVTSIEKGKVVYEHIYWDQGSLLRAGRIDRSGQKCQ